MYAQVDKNLYAFPLRFSNQIYQEGQPGPKNEFPPLSVETQLIAHRVAESFLLKKNVYRKWSVSVPEKLKCKTFDLHSQIFDNPFPKFSFVLQEC